MPGVDGRPLDASTVHMMSISPGPVPRAAVKFVGAATACAVAVFVVSAPGVLDVVLVTTRSWTL